MPKNKGLSSHIRCYKLGARLSATQLGANGQCLPRPHLPPTPALQSLVCQSIAKLDCHITGTGCLRVLRDPELFRQGWLSELPSHSQPFPNRVPRESCLHYAGPASMTQLHSHSICQCLFLQGALLGEGSGPFTGHKCIWECGNTDFQSPLSIAVSRLTCTLDPLSDERPPNRHPLPRQSHCYRIRSALSAETTRNMRRCRYMDG